MINHGTGWVRMEFLVPVARPDRLPHRVPHRDPRHRHRRTTSSRATSRGSASCATRPTGSLVADRAGVVDRRSRCSTCRSAARCSSSPATEVYEGMIVGENSRSDDMDVNITKEKKLTNMRSSTGDELERLVPPRSCSPGAGAGVLPRGRVRRGHPGRRPDPQGRARPATERGTAARAKTAERGPRPDGCSHGRPRSTPRRAPAALLSAEVRSAL